MFRDKKKNDGMSIKKGAEGKLLKTSDGEFQVLIFTENQEIIGQGSYGKCYLGILKSSQSCSNTDNNFQNEQQQDKAQDLNLSKHPIVAVKEIKKDIKKPQNQRLYRKQIQNLSLVTKVQGTNKNLVKCYPFVLSSKDSYYMVMEYCDGKSLDRLMHRRLNSGRWFNFFEFLKIFADILNGYYPLNKIMIIHDDLKPQNIFIKGKDFKIGDFGLSFLMKGQKEFGRGGSLSFNGIQKYQRNKSNPCHKSDMYALGVILFKLFYGSHPYFQRREFLEYKAKQTQKIKALMYIKNKQFQIDQRYISELFVNFYQKRNLRTKDPFVKKPQLKKDMRSLYGIVIEDLYLNKISELILRLVSKKIEDRPSFTEVYLFLKQNKVKQILKYVQQTSNQGSSQIEFFQDLEEQSFSDIKLSFAFNKLSSRMYLEQGPQIQREDVSLPTELLRTAGINKQRKMALVKRYPRVFKLKQTIENVNGLSRLLMDVYHQLHNLNLAEFFSSSKLFIETEKDFDEQSFRQCNQNQRLYFEDKKVEVQFVVEKYLLSFLILVIKESQKQMKSLDQSQLQVYYKENVDLLLQLVEKNKEYLESQLFIGPSDQLSFDKNQKDLLGIICDELLKDITLDENNLILVYYCLTILNIKDLISQQKTDLTEQKINAENQRLNQTNQEQSSLQLIRSQWNSVRSSKNMQSHFQFELLQSLVVKQLKKYKIDYLISIK